MRSLSSDDNPTNSILNFRTPKAWKMKICKSEIEFWKERGIANEIRFSNIPQLENEIHILNEALNRDIEEPKNREELMLLLQEKNRLECRKGALYREIKRIKENVPEMMIKYYGEILERVNGEQ